MKTPTLPDIWPLGIALETLPLRILGADPSVDEHQLRDLDLHLATYVEHSSGADQALQRGDLYNAVVEQSDAAINLFFAWVVASRIVNADTRQRAFTSLNAR